MYFAHTEVLHKHPLIVTILLGAFMTLLYSEKPWCDNNTDAQVFLLI